MKKGLIALAIFTGIVALLSLMVWGLIVDDERRAANKAISNQTRPMPIEWCIEICREDIFRSMHTSGKSWGTSSSSLNGMSESNTFTKVISHCESVYQQECVQVKDWSKPYIHSVHSDRAARK